MHVDFAVVLIVSPNLPMSRPSTSTGAARNPARYALNSVAHSNSADRRQPYPKAKPQKFTIYPHSSNSTRSTDAMNNDIDANRYLKPKSRLKIAWSNENRTMNRTASGKRTTSQNSSKNMFLCRNDSNNNSMHMPPIIDSPPSPLAHSYFGTESKVSKREFVPLQSMQANISQREYTYIGEHMLRKSF
jgi:hypothetical protein